MGEEDKNWLLIKEKSAENPFDNAEVQLAKLVTDLPKGDDWLYEVKYDGYRIAAYAENGKVRLMTRNGYDFGDKFSGRKKRDRKLGGRQGDDSRRRNGRNR